jgi:hypothetical protein
MSLSTYQWGLELFDEASTLAEAAPFIEQGVLLEHKICVLIQAAEHHMLSDLHNLSVEEAKVLNADTWANLRLSDFS